MTIDSSDERTIFLVATCRHLGSIYISALEESFAPQDIYKTTHHKDSRPYWRRFEKTNRKIQKRQ